MPAAPAAPKPAGFSLGEVRLGGDGGGFSLDAKPKRPAGPITAPMPTGEIPGAPLPVELEANREMAELQAQFSDKKLTEAEFYQKKAREEWRRGHASDVSYWCGLVFANNHDLNVFLEQLRCGVTEQFLDGYEVAERLGFTVPRTGIPDPRVTPLEMWSDLALTVDEAPLPSVPVDFDVEFE